MNKILKISADPKLLSEKEIQTAFEESLDSIERGLIKVASYVGTAVGIIDCLALNDSGSPVVIEFKKSGRPAYEAFIQVLDYAVWCRDNFSWLEKTIRNLGFDRELSRNIGVMVVASDFDDRLKRATLGAGFDVQLVSFGIYDYNAENIIVPRIEIDSSSRPVGEPAPPKTKSQHFSDSSEDIKSLFERFEKRVLEIGGMSVNYQPQNYVGFRLHGQNIVAAHPKLQWIRLDFRLTKDEALSEKYVETAGQWGYFHLKNETIDEAVRLVSVSVKKISDEEIVSLPVADRV